MTGPVQLGVLGCTDSARRHVLPSVGTWLRTVAVASRSLVRAEEFAWCFGGEPVEGYQRLLDRDDVEAVYISLPSDLHAEWIERALLAGKHVLAEKPLTASWESAVRLVALAESEGLVLMENFRFLHHIQHGIVRATLREIGSLREFSATFTIPSRPPGDIRLDPALGGGALLDNGSYPLRAAQMFLGPDLQVGGAVLRVDPDSGVDLGGSALLYRADGVTARLAFGIDDHYVCEYELLGTAGRMSLRRAFTPPPNHQPVLRIERSGEVEERLLPADDQYANTLRAFALAVRGNNPHYSLDSTLRHADLLDSVRIAAMRTAK